MYAAAAARGAAPAAEGEEEAKAEELLAECAICLAEFGEQEEVARDAAVRATSAS